MAEESLEEAIGYRFKDRALLRRALRHSSVVHESRGAGPAESDNEMLEFLGDAVLGFLLSEALVERFPAESEGGLSKRKAHFASGVHLHEVARELDLGAHLLLGRGEEMSGGRTKKALLVNALEALIAAVYLDGGIEPVRRLVRDRVMGPCAGASDDGVPKPPMDYKTALQELAQQRQLPHPRYATVEEQGPQHSKTFLVEVRLGAIHAGRGEGQSKKAASQAAAREAFEKLS